MNIAQHTESVWRNKADFVIGVMIDDPVWSEEYAWEQLAAREIDDNLYEVCCIPFMVYDLALGDIVTIDGDLNINRIIKRSGHVGFRAITNNEKNKIN